MLHAEKLATAGRLTASIAHEINNPLQSVQNCLHLAQRGELPLERRAGYMEMAEKELNRLMNIVSRMLKFYRPGQLDRKPTYLNQLLGNVLELTQNQLISQNIDLVTYFDPDLPAVMVVADQIQQVFMNLILNACQAMEGRPGCLTITTSVQGSPEFPPRKPLDRCSAQVNVDFTDTGSGLSEEALDRLFEPFYSTKEEGSGLGLSISYGIISAHGGEITVHNSSHGATFRVSLYTGECT